MTLACSSGYYALYGSRLYWPKCPLIPPSILVCLTFCPRRRLTVILALVKWLTDNNWIGKYGSHKYSVITIPTAVSAASNVSTNDNRTLIKFHSGVRKFEVC